MEGRPNVNELIRKTLDEADSHQGTWSLATHNMILQTAEYFNINQTQEYMRPILEKLLDAETRPDTRYKLAQICTALKAKNINGIPQIFADVKPRVLELMQKIQDNPLGPATSKLLQSIYIPLPCKKPTSASPPPLQTFRPRVQNYSHRAFISRTPAH